MQLSDASIFALSDPSAASYHRLKHPSTGERLPMISPFVPDRVVVNGKSYGLSGASYDARIAHDLVLAPQPAHRLRAALKDGLVGVQTVRERRQERQAAGEPPLTILATEPDDFEVLVSHLWNVLREEEGPQFALAHTIEDFAMPLSVSGYACDKSTYARLGISCFNTLFDPGFIGNATLELVNLSSREVVVREGDPICQFVFHWLDRQTGRGYAGKYQFQPKQAVSAILEEAGIVPGDPT